MPIAAWPAALIAAWNRLMGTGLETPWIVPAAAKSLAKLVPAAATVFEFGAGHSTIWWAARVGEVTALEDDPEWYKLIAGRLDSLGLANCKLRLMDLSDFPSAVERVQDGALDVVVVDSNELDPGDRLKCLEASVPKVRPGGYLVLDDSDRASYRGADALLAGWQVTRFVGVKPFPLIAVETSVYQRPPRHAPPAESCVRVQHGLP